MPDLSLNPAELTFSNPATTSTLPSKVNAATTQAPAKATKTANAAPRIDLEPLYTSLKAAISEYWVEYKETIGLFVLGLLNQDELCLRTDHFLGSDSTVQHLHNQLIAGVLANAGREAPEPGVAPWVSANDKPVVLSKPASGDAAEQRLKTEVMQLAPRDRRRLKEATEADASDPAHPFYAEYHIAKQFKSATDAAAVSSAGGKTNWDLEIRKRYVQPLGAETGEFPDSETISNRMTPICYEESLPHGCTATCAHFVATATEHYIKEILSTILNRTRSNIPGGSVNSVLSHRFKKQFQMEEDRVAHGELSRVPGTGLLPVEVREAASRKSLSMHDLKFAHEIGDTGLGQFPLILSKVMRGYEEGEYETYQRGRAESMRFLKEQEQMQKSRQDRMRPLDSDGDVKMNGVNGVNGGGVNGVHDVAEYDEEDENEDWGWTGGSAASREALNKSLEECLTISN